MAPGAVSRKRKADASSTFGNTTTKDQEEDKERTTELAVSSSSVINKSSTATSTSRQIQPIGSKSSKKEEKKVEHSTFEGSMDFLPDEVLCIIMQFLIGGGSNDRYNVGCVCKRFTHLSKKFAWGVAYSLTMKGMEEKKKVRALSDQVDERINDDNEDDNASIIMAEFRAGVYKGEFVDDENGNPVPNGMGVFNKMENDSSTEYYIGQWQEGRKHGNGIYIDRSGRRVYFGVFREGQRHGFGSSFTKNDGGDDFNIDYIGGYENNQRCGIGLTFLRSCNGGDGKVRVSRYGRYNNDKPIGYHMRFKEFLEGTTRTKIKRKLEYFGTSEMAPSNKRLKTNNDHDG